MNAIQTNSQHLLRYLAAAVIVNKRRRNVMKDLVKIIEQESYEYRDPITGESQAPYPCARPSSAAGPNSRWSERRGVGALQRGFSSLD